MAEIQIGKVAVRFMGAYSSTTEYMKLDIATNSVGDWFAAKQGKVGSPIKGQPLPTVTNGMQSASDYWQLVLPFSLIVTKTETFCNNMPKVGENGNWQTYKMSTGSYVDTGVYARGGTLYPIPVVRNNHLVVSDNDSNLSERIELKNNKLILKLG